MDEIEARWIHQRTGEPHPDRVRVRLVTRSERQAAEREESWKRIADLHQKLAPLGYEISYDQISES